MYFIKVIDKRLTGNECQREEAASGMKRKTATTTDLKMMNRNKVYRYIYEQGNVSKQDIVQGLGLSLPTVSQNLTELFDLGLLCYAGTFASSGGRKPRMISIIPEARMTIGLEVKRDYVNLLAIDLKANARSSKRLDLAFATSDHYGQSLAAEIERYIHEEGIDPESILGVGISIPGVLSEDKMHLINAPSLRAKHVPIDAITKYIPYDTFTENDANASAFAELHSREDLDYLAFLCVSEGVGGALTHHRMPYTGVNNKGAEFGHMTVVHQGRPCACGNLGCLEAYISVSVLSCGEEAGIDAFFAHLGKGLPECQSIWEEYRNFLCMGINNLRTIFDCDVVLGGTLARYLEEKYVEEIKGQLSELAIFERDTDYFHLTNYTYNACAIGTALHFVDLFIQSV